MYHRRLPALLLLALISLPVGIATASAQSLKSAKSAKSAQSAPLMTEKIGPKLRLARDIVTGVGIDLPLLETNGLPTDIERQGMGATLRFGQPLEEAARKRLGKAGIRLQTHAGGRPVQVGDIYAAYVPWEAFDTLRAEPTLLRAEATWRPVVEPPLEVTARKAGALDLRKRPEFGLDGEGVLLGDIDSGFDIFHPHLFRADGGQFEWVDVDDDGRFTPGIDGVDLDADGFIGPNETLTVLDGTVYAGAGRQNEDGALQADRDWLYVDANGDGKRNVGPEAGFDESTPAYGEPIFVVDDVDDDNGLDPRERLVRLGSSKFKKVVHAGKEYIRGKNLIRMGKPSSEDRPFHGTGVASTLVGGQPGYHRRVGLAPAADLIGYAYSSESRNSRNRFARQLRHINDAIQEDVDILVHEWTDLFSTPMDGSTNLEQAMDRARKAGVAQVNPLGNMNGSAKHLERTAKPGEKLELKFQVDKGYQYRGRTYPYRTAWASLFWRTDQQLKVTLTTPAGDSIVVPTNGRKNVGNVTVGAQFGTSMRQTRQVILAIWDGQRQSLPAGEWTLTVEGIQKKDTLTGRIIDRYSGWQVGIRWKNPTTNRGTLVFPSTADSAFGVAAYAGRHGRSTSQVDELRDYSGRGPRIDGTRAVDIAAPDDPFVAFGISPQWEQQGIGNSWFRTFGGTSGAGPHVAASMALLLQRNPKWGPDELEGALLESADTAALNPHGAELPNRHWGAGRLNAYRAVTGNDIPAESRPPTAGLQVAFDDPTVTLDATGSTDPEGEALEYRFDYDHDGTWDTPWQQRGTASADVEFFGGYGQTVVARVEIRDPAGLRSGALGTAELEEEPDLADPAPDVGAADTGVDPQPDTGTTSGPDTGTDAGGDAGRADTGEFAWDEGPKSDFNGGDDGCRGCTSGQDAPPAGLAALVFLAGLLGLRRRLVGR